VDSSYRTKQVSLFLENKPGRLAAVCDLLATKGVNLRALCVADAADFGVLRLIVEDPDEAACVLHDAGYAVSETDVLAVPLEDRPGGLARVTAALAGAAVNVTYMYAFLSRVEGRAVVIVRVEDTQFARAVEALGAAGIPVLQPGTL